MLYSLEVPQMEASSLMEGKIAHSSGLGWSMVQDRKALPQFQPVVIIFTHSPQFLKQVHRRIIQVWSKILRITGAQMSISLQEMRQGGSSAAWSRHRSQVKVVAPSRLTSKNLLLALS
jgi:hypothetical protein